jgi:hypothetical protein
MTERNESFRSSFPIDCLAGDGEMAALMRDFDWAATPLGALSVWPQSLRTAVNICLASRFPTVLYWGSAYVTLYNDAYAVILAKKHSWALGRAAQEVWAEIWDVTCPMLEKVMTIGEATWSDDLLLTLQRNGYSEECYFSFSFSPVRGEAGTNAGVFTAVTETTARVRGDRRQRTLRDLAAGSAKAKTGSEACQIAMDTLAQNPQDAPCALLYLLEPDRKQARLAVRAGVSAGESGIALVVKCSDEGEAGQSGPAVFVRSEPIQPVEDLSTLLTEIPSRPWLDPPRSAAVLPIPSITNQLTGFLVLGLSSRLRLLRSLKKL